MALLTISTLFLGIGGCMLLVFIEKPLYAALLLAATAVVFIKLLTVLAAEPIALTKEILLDMQNGRTADILAKSTLNDDFTEEYIEKIVTTAGPLLTPPKFTLIYGVLYTKDVASGTHVSIFTSRKLSNGHRLRGVFHFSMGFDGTWKLHGLDVNQ